MKKLLFLLISTLTFFSWGTELTTYYSMNNFSFSNNNTIDSNTYYFEFGELVTQEITDGLYLDTGFTKSIITDYSIFTDFRISNDLFGFNIGIFTNFLNDSSKILTPGLNYGLKFKLPGILLLNLDLNNTIPNTSPLEKGISITNYNIRLGFYIGEAILSGNLKSESNSKGTVLSSSSTTSTKYFLNLDLFNKYSIYRISIDMGWQTLNRKVTSLSTSGTTLTGVTDGEYEAGTVFFNGLFTLLFTDYLSVDLGILLNLIKMPIKGLDSFPGNEFNWGTNISIKFIL